MIEHPGRAFQEQTRYSRRTMEGRALDWRSKPPAYKFYADVPVIGLPAPVRAPEAVPTLEEDAKPAGAPGLDLWTCVGLRRSVRSYSAAPLTLLDLSRLLWASAGLTRSFTTTHGQDFYRASPSAGALYPIETYVVANAVEGLEPGLYHYRVTGIDVLERPVTQGCHSLEQLRTGDLRAEVAAAALDQPMCARAGAVFLWTAVFVRSEWKYRERAYRYVYLDAGHVAAQLSLAAVALGLGSCPVAAFYDDEADALVGIDGRNEAVIYMTAVGNPSRPVRASPR
jgi:SagB-type dehydrogenase family enzyme